jgi:hypothetical protein
VNEDAIRYFYPTQNRPIPLTANRDTRAFPPIVPAAPATQVINGRISAGQVVTNTINDAPFDRYAMPMLATTVTEDVTKPLPEYPNSNRRVMNQVKKYGKLHTPGYAWSSSTIPPFYYLPPTVPPGPVAGVLERQDRLQQVLGGNDSEDEDILLDHSFNSELGGTSNFFFTIEFMCHLILLYFIFTEFNRLLQKHAEALNSAAHAVQAITTTQKKNQQQAQLARIKMSMEV